jgi:2-polyprenyl-6-methoxyphenol hydroxylase-like FAD-dependent oxidoreductase
MRAALESAMLKSASTHAIVIGAGIGGLIAARTLADHYDRVSVLERDTLPPDPEPRKGVPHGRHVHVLLARGREALEQMFPGLTDELVQSGAVSAGPAETIAHIGGAYLAKGDGELRTILSSRAFLETHIRRRLCAHPRVSIREGGQVQALLADGDRVCGVQVAAPPAGEPAARLAADLVVDASGRHTRSPEWLAGLGYERPAEETIGARINYATQLLRRRAEHLQGNRLIVVRAQRPAWRMGQAVAIEHDRWMVMLGGYFDERPDDVATGFMDFARTLAAPDIASLLAVAEPLAPPVRFVFPESRRWRYERLSRFPRGYLVLGDALSSINPANAQGMTVAALEGLALGECLAQGQVDLAQRFFAKASSIVDTSWQIAAGGDWQHPRLAHLRPPASRSAQLVNWYRRKALQAAAVNPSVAQAFLRITNLVDPPRQLLSPATMSRVLRVHLHRSSQAVLKGLHSPRRTMRQAT